MKLTERIDLVMEITRFKKEKGRDPKRGLSKMMEYVDEPYVGLHYSDLNKVGINPDSGYATPMGIYAYIFDREWFDTLRRGKTPFAGKRKYLHLIQIKRGDRKNYIKVRPSGRAMNYSSRQYERDLEVLAPEYGREAVGKTILASGRNPNTVSDAAIARVFKTWAETVERDANVKSPIGYIWAVTYKIANLIHSGRKAITLWNRMLRDLGIDGVIDYGAGLIHENEPRQMVILDPRSYKRVLTVTKEEIERERSAGIADAPEVKQLEGRMKTFFETLKTLDKKLPYNWAYVSKDDLKRISKDFQKALDYWNSIWDDIKKMPRIKSKDRYEDDPMSPQKHLEDNVFKGLHETYWRDLPPDLRARTPEGMHRALFALTKGTEEMLKWWNGWDQVLRTGDVSKAIKYASDEYPKHTTPAQTDLRMYRVNLDLRDMVADILNPLARKSPKEARERANEILKKFKDWGYAELTRSIERDISDIMEPYETEVA